MVNNDFTESVIMMQVCLNQCLNVRICGNLRDDQTDYGDTIHDTPTQALIDLELMTYVCMYVHEIMSAYLQVFEKLLTSTDI